VAFAAQPGLPERALVYGLGQTGVYVFHNGPRYKPYLDGRLEMPDRRTFETYVQIEQWLRANDPKWVSALDELGKPLILLEHQNNYGAEAALMTNPGWRCIYYDALATIFIPKDGGNSEGQFPSVDFAACHFQNASAPSVPDVPGAAAREVKALFNLSASLPRSAVPSGTARIPVLLRALDRATRALEDDATRPDVWVLLGNSYWNLNPDLSAAPPTPGQEWHLEQIIYWAQATYCLRRAVDHQPDDAAAWRYLFSCYRARGMLDAQVTAGTEWLRCDKNVTAKQRAQFENLRLAVAKLDLPGHPSPSELPARLQQMLRSNRAEAACQLIEEAERRQAPTWTWVQADQIAGLYMHLGRPTMARQYWERADGAPSASIRELRLAATYWVERDFEGALTHLGAAEHADADLGEVQWALAEIHAQLGNAEAALAACRRGLTLPLSERQRNDLELLLALLSAKKPIVPTE
jgi:tetratricopeptide (TPR) repeat protein